MTYLMSVTNPTTLDRIGVSRPGHRVSEARVAVGVSPEQARASVTCGCGASGDGLGGITYLEALRGAWRAVSHRHTAA